MIDTLRHFFEACHPFGYPLLGCSVILVAAIFYHALFVGRDKAELAAIARHAEETGDSATTEARLARLTDSWRAGLSVISIITNIAPMLGILGTAWGLAEVFDIFGSPDAQAGIAVGISKALYTTIFGLAIAVPGLIAQVCFERRLERRAAQLNEQFTELLARRNAH